MKLTLKSYRLFARFMVVASVLALGSLARAHGGHFTKSFGQTCSHLLKSETKRNTSENPFKVEVLPPEGKTREEYLTGFDEAIAKLEKLSFQGGTPWLEERFSQRRKSVVDHFKTPGFAKLLLLKPQLRSVFESWSRALDRVSEIESSYAGLNEVERKAFRVVYDAIRSALTSHALSWATVSVRTLDLPRAKKILDEIADFDPSRSKYSLYRIERAIEGRYSIREYAECR